MEKNLHSDLSLLIECSRIDHTREDYYTIANTFKQINHKSKFIELANRHAVFPLLYRTLKKSNSVYAKTLKSHYLTISQFNMYMSSELISIIDLLNNHNIKALAFKGPTLAHIAYGDITLRQFSDIDLLIQKKDSTKMLQIMLNEGYIPQIKLNKKIIKNFLNSVNVLGFYKPSSHIYIEIHWELISKNYAISWKESALWKNLETLHLNQREIFILNNEQQILYLCIHGSKHFFERLSWICDIDRLIRTSSYIDWDFLYLEAKKMGVLRMFFLGLSLCQTLFKLPLTDKITDKIDQDKVVYQLTKQIIIKNFSTNKDISKSYGSFKLLWLMRENTTDKLRFTWYALFSPKLDDFKFIQLPKYLTFLYPLIRPLRLIIKYLK